MKYLTTVIVFLFLFIPVFSQKVALVLSGGGAKGLAHVGVLKLLEEQEIPVDFIVGTSMGGVIGGLYAAGYSATEIEQIVLSRKFQQWVNGKLGEDYQFYYSKSEENAGILNLKLQVDSSLNINTNIADDIAINYALTELLAPASQAANYNFDSLLIPYRAVAADIFTQQTKVLRTGQLNEAIRATLSVPFFFRPLKFKNQYLFDGGIYENFPVNVARQEFNPDVIIGVNVSSKVFEEYPYEQDQELIDQSLLSMLLHKPDLKVLKETDIYVAPDVEDYSSLNFEPVRALVDSGYIAASRSLKEIRQKINRTLTCEELTVARNNFILGAAPLKFSGLKFDHSTEPKRKYLRHFFPEKEYLDIYDIRKGYYKMISEEYFKNTYPGIVYDELDSAYLFEVHGETGNFFDLDLGGNISTRSISQIYLGLNYNYFNRYLFKHRLGVYTGPFYQSVLLASRVSVPTRSRLFYIDPVFVFNHWDFINSTELIFSDKDPTIIDLIDRKFRVNLGVAVGTSATLKLYSSYFNNSNNYSNRKQFQSTDTLDNQSFNGFRHGLEFSRKSLDRKQYATSGRFFLASLDYFDAKETLTPGNTSDLIGSQVQSNNWLRLKLRAEQYFGSGKFRWGYLAEGVFSNQNAGFNLTGSLINAPAFEPLPDSPTIFLENFRAYNYIAGGVRNVYGLGPKIDIRLEGYFFKPLEQIQLDQNTDQIILDNTSDFYFAGTVAGVYHSLLGPVSMQVNYYDDAENQWGFLLHVGYLIFNKKALD